MHFYFLYKIIMLFTCEKNLILSVLQFSTEYYQRILFLIHSPSLMNILLYMHSFLKAKSYKRFSCMEFAIGNLTKLIAVGAIRVPSPAEVVFVNISLYNCQLEPPTSAALLFYFVFGFMECYHEVVLTSNGLSLTSHMKIGKK